MSFPPESIQVGQCYLVEDGYVRRVLRIKQDLQVLYEYRGGPIPDPSLWRRGMQALEAFARAVERSVPCDWTAEVDSNPPTEKGN